MIPQLINREKIYIETIGQYEGKEVKIYGWLYNARHSGKLWFLLLRDGTGLMQCVVSLKDVGEEIFARCEQLTQESSFAATGTVRADKRAPGGYELLAKNIEIVHIAKDYPITPKEHGETFLMDHRHLWLRSSRQHAILRVRHAIIKSIRDFFDSRGFVLIDAPVFTPAACEGTSTLFETDYFGEKAYLTQSGQLYMEPAALAFGKVYCFGPTFRAEKSKTRRHLTEFWMVEPEVAYMDLEGDMQLAEEFIEFIVQNVLTTRREELKILDVTSASRHHAAFSHLVTAKPRHIRRRKPSRLPEKRQRSFLVAILWRGRNVHHAEIRQAGDGASLPRRQR
jgi:asparaginyl-tRNA synthetase